MSDAVLGELGGLKPSQKKALERTLSRRVPPEMLVTPELLSHLFELADDVRRRVGVLIDRRGHVTHVVVGNNHRIYLPDLGRLRAGLGRFRGVRFVQTQPGTAALHADDIADLTKLKLDFIVTASRLAHARQQLVGAHLLPPTDTDGEAMYKEVRGETPDDLVGDDFFGFITELEAEYARALSERGQAKTRRQSQHNRATLVVVSERRADAESRAKEMRELCETAGLEVVDQILQMRTEPDPRTFVGRGKLEEIVLRALQHDADTLVFDRELNPAQVRSIAKDTDLKVLDRAQVILDIFAQHAHSKGGQLQVELAQLEYNLPRLSEMNTAMSRLSGGIGGRGPGETKLEINRRRAKERIHELEDRIDELSQQRELRRKRRSRSEAPIVSIVGYTNAGKSTLLNALTGSEVLVEDKLFATLEPASRQLYLPSGRVVVLSDTVGFIRELPEDLVKAFRATLEELRDSDVLIHLVDASDPERNVKIAAVEAILFSMELARKARITAWNKVDKLSPEEVKSLRARKACVVAAQTREGFDDLRQRIDALLTEIHG